MRPNKEDYLTTNQFTYDEELDKYCDALEEYCDELEKRLAELIDEKPRCNKCGGEVMPVVETYYCPVCKCDM